MVDVESLTHSVKVKIFFIGLCRQVHASQALECEAAISSADVRVLTINHVDR